MTCSSELLKKYIKFKVRTHWEALEAKILYFMNTWWFVISIRNKEAVVVHCMDWHILLINIDRYRLRRIIIPHLGLYSHWVHI